MPQSLYSPLQPQTWLQRVILVLVGLYPLISASVPSGGSAIYILLFLAALFMAGPAFNRLSRDERLWLSGYIGLFVVALIGLGYTEDMHEGGARLERYFRLATSGLVFLLLLRLQLESGRMFLVGIPLAVISLTVQAMYEKQYLGERLADGLYHKIIFGDISVLWFVLMLAALLSVARRAWQRLTLTLSMCAVLYPAIMSATRGSWLALMVVISLLIWLYRGKLSRRGWGAILAGVLASVLVMALWQPRPVMEPLQAGIAEIQRYMQNPDRYADSSWGARLGMWRNSLIIWSENPVFGAGLGDFHAESKKLVADGVTGSKAVLAYGHAHSIFFEALAGLGLVGLIALVSALFILPWRLFHRYWREGRDPWTRFYALGGLVTLMAFFVFGLTEAWMNRMPLVNPYIVCLVVFASSLAARRNLPA